MLTSVSFSVFTGYTKRRANGMTSEWGCKNQNLSHPSDSTERGKMTEKLGEIQGKGDLVRVSKEFELSGFYCTTKS